MDIREWQQNNQTELFHSGTEVLLAMTEEMGEIATEVALLERVGSKVYWQKAPSVERLGEEITHLLNLAAVLANQYGIDLEAVYQAKKSAG